MMASRSGLNVNKVADAIKAGSGRYHDGFGLNLVVTSPQSASWKLRYQIAGRERWLGLGPANLIGLAEARVRARAARLQLLDGFDPIEERRKTRTERALSSARAMTFAQAAREYFASHSDRWKQKQRRFFEYNMATYANPVLGELPVAAIEVGLVMKVIEPMWRAKTTTAKRLRAQIEAVLDWAKVRGYRSGDNPAKWRGHIDKLLPAPAALAKVEHLAALPYVEVATFLDDLRTKDGLAAKALEFAILTAARTGEVIGAKWSEVDLTAGTWTVPKERMKGGREHRVPLSEGAIELLRGLPREADFVFIGTKAGRGLSPMAMANVLKRMKPDITVHGFRSSFRDWAAETTNYPNHIVEMALAHKITNAVEAAYRRGDLFEKRRQLMAAWAAYCDDVGGSVVPLRAVS
jgi:integrase